MKSVLLSVRPQWVAKILNGKKTIEIRKKFPKGYVGWLYIYCTKDVPLKQCEHFRILGMKCANKGYYLNGKVVARFWVDKVGWFSKEIFGTYEEPFTYNQDDLLKKSCLTAEDLDNYLQGKIGYAIHIQKLEIFDKPKEISEFYKIVPDNYKIKDTKTFINNSIKVDRKTDLLPLTRAPQSWCYVEV